VMQERSTEGNGVLYLKTSAASVTQKREGLVMNYNIFDLPKENKDIVNNHAKIFILLEDKVIPYGREINIDKRNENGRNNLFCRLIGVYTAFAEESNLVIAVLFRRYGKLNIAIHAKNSEMSFCEIRSFAKKEVENIIITNEEGKEECFIDAI